MSLQELYRLLANDDRDVTDMVKSTLQHQPFELVCHRLLHHADDEYLFYFTCGILSRSQSLDSFQLLHKQHILQSATSEQAVMQVKLQLDAMLSLMLYGLIKFKDLDSMLIAVAAAFHIQDVIKLLEEAGKLQVSNPCILHSAPLFVD